MLVHYLNYYTLIVKFSCQIYSSFRCQSTQYFDAKNQICRKLDEQSIKLKFIIIKIIIVIENKKNYKENCSNSESDECDTIIGLSCRNISDSEQMSCLYDNISYLIFILNNSL